MVAAILVVVVVAGGLTWRWWHNHVPFGPEALAITSSLSFVGYEDAQATLGKTAYAPYPFEGDQLVLGRVSWQAPPQPFKGSFTIFLIDKRTNRKAAHMSADQEVAGAGSAGSDNKVAERYAWLSGAGAIPVNGGWRTDGVRLGVDERVPVLTFVAIFHSRQDGEPLPAIGPIALSDMLLALVYMGPDDQVYWAQRLQG